MFLNPCFPGGFTHCQGLSKVDDGDFRVFCFDFIDGINILFEYLINLGIVGNIDIAEFQSDRIRLFSNAGFNISFKIIDF